MDRIIFFPSHSELRSGRKISSYRFSKLLSSINVSGIGASFDSRIVSPPHSTIKISGPFQSASVDRRIL